MRTDEVSAAFAGERLRLARYRARLTVRELAERAEISHAAVSQYEAERIRPTAQTVARLAVATGVPAGFFAYGRRRVCVGGLDGTHFRSLRSTSRASRLQAWAWAETVLDVTSVVERHVRLPDVALPLRPVAEPGALDEAAAAADELRQAWQLPLGPVGHLVRHMEAHGIVTARLPVVDEGIDAFSHAQGPRPVVILGTGKADAARSRFDAAHELGHLVCHPDADPGSGPQEQQAHAFAAELLMPRAVIEPLLPRRFDLGAYARLKADFGVSVRALLYRARTLGVISESAYKRAVVSLNAGYGRSEPFPLPAPETPRLLAAAVEVATAERGVHLADLASEAELPVDDVRAVVGEALGLPAVELHDTR